MAGEVKPIRTDEDHGFRRDRTPVGSPTRAPEGDRKPERSCHIAG